MRRRIDLLQHPQRHTRIDLRSLDVGIIQALVSDYETGKLRLSADMAVRFARALEVTTDDLLQPKKASLQKALKPSRKVLRRMSSPLNAYTTVVPRP